MTEKAKLMDLAKHIIRNFGNSSDLTTISVADIDTISRMVNFSFYFQRSFF